MRQSRCAFKAALAGASLSLLAVPALAEDGVCAPAPEPVLSLSYGSRYDADDPTRSQIDEEGEAAAKAALDPLDAFLRDLAKMSDDMLTSDGDRRAALADCLMAKIATWAKADALSDLGAETVDLTIGSRLAAFALITRAATPHTSAHGDLTHVRDWLSRRIEAQMRFWEAAPRGAAQGNLRAWAALAAAAVADVTGDAVVRGWAAWSTAYVVCTAGEDGSLPQEMRRGKYALHYQLHALAPLVTAAVLLERQGVRIVDRCDGALDRAARFALADLADGSLTRAITGVEQSLFDGTSDLRSFQVSWLAAYLHIRSDPEIERLIAAYQPLSYSKLGGDQSLLWAR